MFSWLPLLCRFAVPLLLLALTATAEAAGAMPTCRQDDAVRIWTAPLAARPGEPLSIMAVATDAALSGLAVIDPAGRRSELPTVPGGGPPWSGEDFLRNAVFDRETGTRLKK